MTPSHGLWSINVKLSSLCAASDDSLVSSFGRSRESKHNFRVRVGDSEKSRRDPSEQEFEVEELVTHPRYTCTNTHAAVMKLSQA